MLNINYYKGESFDFYESVVESKRSEALRRRLQEIHESQSSCFADYDLAFPENEMGNIPPQDYQDIQKQSLISLYNYRSKKIRELKEFLTQHPNFDGRPLSKCQYCTINEADSMDHILGKTNYPEFSVHPKNLIPCCTSCNRKKSSAYQDNEGRQLFLNLYLDNLPTSQYLFVSFGKDWLPEFSLEKPDDVSPDFFSVIESHYTKLDLLTRFQRSSIEDISELQTSVTNYGYGERAKSKIDEYCDGMAHLIGYNHPKIIVHRALCKSKTFIDWCLENA